VILIASSATSIVESWEQALEGFAAILAVRRFDALKETLSQLTPDVLLLDIDLHGLDGLRGVGALRMADPLAKVIVFSDAVSDEMEIALFKLGVRGCALRRVEPQLLKRVIVAIQAGELWIRRAITPRLLDELRAQCRRDKEARSGSEERFDVLTEREREIAALIGSGESNKQIARALCITERTVKSHVTGIFRKLGVADRVRLAIRVASQREPVRERMC